MRLNEFIHLLEIERRKSGEENPFVNIGSKKHNGGFHISNGESISDRMGKEIFITPLINKI